MVSPLAEERLCFSYPDEMSDGFVIKTDLENRSCKLMLEKHEHDNHRALVDSVISVARSLSEPPRTLVDIGASVGVFSGLLRALFHRIGPPMTIWAYEPLPLLFSHLVQNMARMPGAGWFYPLQLAVWEQTATVQMLRRFNGVEQTGLVFRHDTVSSALAMTIHINDVLRMAIDLSPVIDVLKIDVEGSEYIFLPKADPELLGHVRFISLDTHDVRDSHYFAPEFAERWVDFTVLMRSYGFAPVETVPPSPLWRNTRL